jgi:hypothetical protein
MKYALLSSLSLSLSLAFLSGCDVARENVLASVDTVIGLSVGQNEKTASYEAKAGYTRSQTYSVPTGKLVVNDPNNPNGMISNEADRTPQVVGALVVESGVKELFIGMNVKELFAVGEAGVASPAAAAMFVAQAQSDKKAEQAASALGASTYSVQAIGGSNAIYDAWATNPTEVEAVIKEATGMTWSEFEFASPADSQKAYAALKKSGHIK